MITIRIDPTRNNLVVKVVGYIAEKQAATIRKISWEGMDDLGNVFVTLLKKRAAIQVGEVFAIEAVKETEGQALNQLHEMSFGFATVRAEVDSYPEDGAVDIRVIAETGPACRFGPITITGKYDIPEEFVRNEVSIKEGAAFRVETGGNPAAPVCASVFRSQRGARFDP